ncbi:MAG TPA: hypothetical protein VKE26_01610 [Xanthobacteraceae bacterium]|nr:hypothetical protein [Xanthobacteraceae bacterium]
MRAPAAGSHLIAGMVIWKIMPLTSGGITPPSGSCGELARCGSSAYFAHTYSCMCISRTRSLVVVKSGSNGGSCNQSSLIFPTLGFIIVPAKAPSSVRSLDQQVAVPF